MMLLVTWPLRFGIQLRMNLLYMYEIVLLALPFLFFILFSWHFLVAISITDLCVHVV